MGRPKDRKELELQRAHEELAKGYSATMGERTAAALVQLPPAQRQAYLKAVRPLFASAVQHAQAAHSHDRLAKLAAVAAQEPGLLLTGDEMAGRDQLWALLWGAAQRRDWTQAAQLVDALRGDLDGRAPALLAWLTSWVQGRGEIGGAVVLPSLPVVEERLGYERTMRTPAPEPPTDPEQVEAAVCSAAVTLRPMDFRALMFSWVQSLPAPLVMTVRVVVGRLALRDALRGAPERRHQAPLALLAAMASGLSAVSPGGVRAAGNPQRTNPLSELAAEALVGLRLANNYRGSPMSEEEARTLTALALAAAADAAQRSVVSAYVAKLQFPAAVSGRALLLYEELLAAAPEPQLWASAVTHWMAADDQADVPPVSRFSSSGSSSASFFVATLEQLMAGADTASLNWLRQLTVAQQDLICSFLATEAPAALGLELADRGWAAADAELQHRLAKLVVELIEVNLSDDAQLIAQVHTVGDFLPMVRRLIPPDIGGWGRP